MPKDPPKPAARARPATVRPSGRRTSLRRQRTHPAALLRAAMRSPVFGYAALTCALFAIFAAAVATWAREQPLIAVGRVMTETRVVRVPFKALDEAATNDARELARGQAPRVYIELPALKTAIDELRSLPSVVAEAESIETIAPEIQQKFSLDPERLEALKRYAPGAPGADQWRDTIGRLATELRRHPMAPRDAAQVEASQTFRKTIEVRHEGGVETLAKTTGASPLINVGQAREHVEVDLLILARNAQAPEQLRKVIIARLMPDPVVPLFRLDETATAEKQAEAAASVEPVFREEPQNKPIYTRGEELTAAQFALFMEERDRFREATPVWTLWLHRIGLFAVVIAITLAGAVYLALFNDRVRRNPHRMAGIALTLGATMAIACVGAVLEPRLLTLFGVAPSVFVAVILVIAYDQRMALAISALHAALVCIALSQSVVFFVLILTGCGVAIWQLAEIRDRRTLISMAVMTGAALTVGTALTALVERPINLPSLMEILWDSGFGGAGGLLVG
ncbi:MAG: hypothetical protein ACF8R7_16850, partial [Phycisphaerales bacterium JB039]